MKKTVSAKKPMSKTAVEKASKLAPAPKTKASKERPSKASTDKPPKPKPAKEKSTKTTLPQSTDKGKVFKVCKAKSPFQLVDEPYEELAHSELIHELIHQGGVAIREPIVEATRPLLVVKGKGKAIATEEPAAHTLLALHTLKRRSTTDQFVLQRRTPVTKEASIRPSAQA
nr:hypothetical protein [Tanacetum cinerariifolium]